MIDLTSLNAKIAAYQRMQKMSDNSTLTLERAKRLRYGQTLYHRIYRNADGSPQRWRVNGKPRTWVTRPDEVVIPVKRGLYEYAHVNEHDLDDYALTEASALEDGS